MGAGPVGAGAALLLKRAGIAARIIEKAEEPSRHSKALAVNPRTLELLQSTGVTDKMLALGLRIRTVRFHFSRSKTAELSFDSLQHEYPFMLALSQATTERLLKEALAAAGEKVECGTELIACRTSEGGVEAQLRHSSDGSIENVNCPWLLAADGAHSTVRKSLNIQFCGSSFEKPWYLVDIPLTTRLEQHFGHVFFPKGGGFIFLIRVVDETTERSQGPKLWRVISDAQNCVEQIPDVIPAASAVWTSEFYISHRINEHLQAGNIYFAGDAAHIHSPMGARGMNLGLEDAWVFSRLVELNRINDYERLRYDCDHAVVKRVELLSRMALGESFFKRAARAVLIRGLLRMSFMRKMFLTTASGLDHSLELEKRSTAAQSSASREGHSVVHRRTASHHAR
ncbi:MAG TPA: FAD-dependent monooxygenase [Verrucomicrobiae bacterium]